MAQAPDAERLFTSSQPQLVRYLTRLVGNADAARDLTQDTFLRAARARVPEDEAAQRAWLFRIARNLALNHMRDRSRRPQSPAGNAPDGAGASQETALLVREALAQLSPADREVFLLRESGGLNYGEIADACALTEDAVRARLQRARQALRVMLEGTLRAEHARGVRFTGRNDT
jgi:RNA polymerase sigma-70 factor (ECF subfamily)